MRLIWTDKPQNVETALLALMQTQSLTAALKASGVDFAVQVRAQGALLSPWDDERLAAQHYGREVHLLLEGEPVVWARSVCAQDADFWRAVLDCGEHPLGARLFGGDVQAKRSAFRYAYVEAGQVPQSEAPLWLRQSRFIAHDETLILTEAFLPALAKFLR